MPTDRPNPILRGLVVSIFLAAITCVSAAAQPWERLGLEGVDTAGLEVDPARSSVIYAGLDDGAGIARSIDGGVTWSTISTGFAADPSALATAFAVDPATPDHVLVGFQVISENANLYESTNGGTSWSPATSGLPSGTISALAFDPATPSTVYAASNGFGVAKSTDGGATWSDASSGLEDGFCSVSCVLDLAIDPDAPSTLYAAVPTTATVYKSTNGGSTWSATPLSMMAEQVKIDPFDSQTVLANSSLGGFSRSTNGGATWSSLEGPGSGLPNGAVFHTIAFDPQQAGHVYVEANFEVYRSTDGGDTWSLFQGGLSGLQIKTLAHNGLTVLATTDDGVYGAATALFADGFESGGTSAWSLAP